MPLVIALHGYGGDENTWFERFAGVLPRLAEQSGFILAAPAAYPRGASVGWSPMPKADATATLSQQRSEESVIEVLAEMTRAYRVDARRVYLLGHSMGGTGVWMIASKFPERWAAIAPLAAPAYAPGIARTWHIPTVMLHGDADPAVDISTSRLTAESLRARGAQVRLIEVAGGGHANIVETHLPQVLDFLARH